MPEPRRSDLPRGIFRFRDRYRVRIYHEGVQHSLGVYETLGDAKAAAAIARGEMARGIFIAPSQRRREIRDTALQERVQSLTVTDWAADWLQRLESMGRSLGTTRSYSSTLKVHVLPALGDRRLVDVTTDDIDGLLQGVRGSGGPWANVARTVRAMFAAAIAARVGGLIESPVHVSVPKPSARSRSLDVEQVATPAEVRAMTAAMPAHLAIAVPLAAWCALRQGEVLGLQRRDLEHLDDPARATLHVRRQWHSKSNPPAYAPPKDGSTRSVAIPDALLPPLREHIEHHAGPGREGPVLPSPQNAAVPVSQTAFDRRWKRARDAVKPGFWFHDLRHTGLTAYAQQGATLEELMRRGGHKNIEAASRYQHATVERDRSLTAKLNSEIAD